MMTNFKIDIVSDTVCAWCYVGKKKLDRAISLYRSQHPASNTQHEDTFTVNWHPYQLQPDAPSPGVDKRAFHASKFSNPAQASRIFQNLESVGKSVGINFRFGGLIGNTRNSHRLIQLAGRSGSGKEGTEMQNRVVEQLFVAYNENEEDIADREVLCACAVRAGLPEDQVRQWLKEGNDVAGDIVDREVQEARARGVSGVPNFTLQGKYAIGGAQDPEAFVKIFEKIKEMEG